VCGWHDSSMSNVMTWHVHQDHAIIEEVCVCVRDMTFAYHMTLPDTSTQIALLSKRVFYVCVMPLIHMKWHYSTHSSITLLSSLFLLVRDTTHPHHMTNCITHCFLCVRDMTDSYRMAPLHHTIIVFLFFNHTIIDLVFVCAWHNSSISHDTTASHYDRFGFFKSHYDRLGLCVCVTRLIHITWRHCITLWSFWFFLNHTILDLVMVGACHNLWLRLVDSLKLYVSFAKEPCKRDLVVFGACHNLSISHDITECHSINRTILPRDFVFGMYAWHDSTRGFNFGKWYPDLLFIFDTVNTFI